MKRLLNAALRLPIRQSALALACCLSASPALADELALVPLDDIFASYQAICLANPGDAKAQVAAASAAPYSFKRDLTQDDGTVNYENGRLSLRILDKPGQRYCMVLAPVDEAIGTDAGVELAAPVLGKPDVVREEVAVWRNQLKDKPANQMFITMQSNDGQRMAGYMVAAQ